MMQMDFMFSEFGTVFGIVGMLIILATIFFALKLIRGLIERKKKEPGKIVSKTSKMDTESFHAKIMKLALENKGVLTVTDVVVATGLSLKQAEETLNSMVDEYRVKMEVKDSGIIAYEFIEIINKKEMKKMG